MLFIKFLLLFVAAGFLACAVGMVIYDIFLAFQLDRLLRRNEPPEPGPQLQAEGTASTDLGSRGALPPSLSSIEYLSRSKLLSSITTPVTVAPE